MRARIWHEENSVHERVNSMNETKKKQFMEIPKPYCPDEALKRWKLDHGCKWCFDYTRELYSDCKRKWILDELTS